MRNGCLGHFNAYCVRGRRQRMPFIIKPHGARYAKVHTLVVRSRGIHLPVQITRPTDQAFQRGQVVFKVGVLSIISEVGASLFIFDDNGIAYGYQIK